MDVRRLTDELAVSGQITADDVARISAAGFRSIVCNRPDGEAADQTPFSEIEAAAKACGIEIVWQPVDGRQVTDDDGVKFGEIVAGLEVPVLAYCRTGTRCTVLWSLAEAQRRPILEIVAMAAEAGYNVAPLALRLEALKERRAK